MSYVENLQHYGCGEIDIKMPPKGKYAVVGMLIINDFYLPAALVMAYCMRKQIIKSGVAIDLVIMVTDDISHEAREYLQVLYDKIVTVDYIIPKYGKIKSKLLSEFPHYSKTFTKINIFKLVDYDKVIYIDIDSAPYMNFLTLFNLEPPAAPFYGEPLFGTKENYMPHMVENNWMPRKKGDNYMWNNKYCDCCSHGKKIDKKYTDVMNYMNSPTYLGMAVELMVLKPSLDTYNTMMNLINTSKDTSYFYKSDGFFFTQFFSGQWTSIDHRFNGFLGYPHPLLLWGIQNGGIEKPWSIGGIITNWKFNDYWTWYYFFMRLVNKYPVLLKHEKISLINNSVKDIFGKYLTDKSNHIIARQVLEFDSMMN